VQVEEFCREIETYLCRKNDGHLIRVVGPSFAIVSGWAEQGVPLKIAFAGIDRYFERYYRSGPRRRPVKIDFCEADVLDVFDEWRRATGVVRRNGDDHQSGEGDTPTGPAAARSRMPSLPEHLQRVVTRLTSARASGALGAAADALIDRAAAELDAARARAGGIRGAARAALLARLDALDRELLQTAAAQLDAESLAALSREADEDLQPFRQGMAPDAYAQARSAALDRLIRAQFNLPTVSYDG
jgi:hypothetical protein